MVTKKENAIMKRAALHLLCATVIYLVTAAAMADVVPVVAANSPVTSLSEDQLTDIFLGRVRRYPNGLPAVPIDLAEGSRARDEFYAKFFGKTPAQVKAFWAKLIFTGRGQPPKEVPDESALKKLIVKNPGAMGYIERDLVDSSVRVLAQQSPPNSR